MPWIERDTVLSYVPEKYQPRDMLAIFSLYGTLINGATVRAGVAAKVRAIHERGGSVIVVDNCPRMSQHRRALAKLEAECPGVPIVALISTRPNMYKKPGTRILAGFIGAGTLLNKSIVVGHNAGRYGDSSDCDRALAFNLNIPNFRTPEQFFDDDYATRRWRWMGPSMAHASINHAYAAFPFEQIYRLPQSTTIIYGPRRSGRSTLARAIAEYHSGATVRLYDITVHKSVDNISRALWADIKDSGAILPNTHIIIIADLSADDVSKLPRPRIRVQMGTDFATCRFFNQAALQTAGDHTVEEVSEEEIYAYFAAQADHGAYKFFPALRDGPELHMRYSVGT